MNEQKPLEIGTRVQQLGDDCEAGYLQYGKICEVNTGPFGKGFMYNIKIDNGSISTSILRGEMRLETDPPYKNPFDGFQILRTDLSQYSTEELEAEFNKRKKSP